jgi:hypothetical protein
MIKLTEHIYNCQNVLQVGSECQNLVCQQVMSGPSHARVASPKLYRWSALQVIEAGLTG